MRIFKLLTIIVFGCVFGLIANSLGDFSDSQFIFIGAIVAGSVAVVAKLMDDGLEE